MSSFISHLSLPLRSLISPSPIQVFFLPFPRYSEDPLPTVYISLTKLIVWLAAAARCDGNGGEGRQVGTAPPPSFKAWGPPGGKEHSHLLHLVIDFNNIYWLMNSILFAKLTNKLLITIPVLTTEYNWLLLSHGKSLASWIKMMDLIKWSTFMILYILMHVKTKQTTCWLFSTGYIEHFTC